MLLPQPAKARPKVVGSDDGCLRRGVLPIAFLRLQVLCVVHLVHPFLSHAGSRGTARYLAISSRLVDDASGCLAR